MDFTQALRIILAVLAGKSSGGGSPNLVFRNINDLKDRVNAVVTRKGDRISMTLDST